MKAIHFGAGSIGRGFIGEILHKNNYQVTFVDMNSQIINQLNRDEGYLIQYLDTNETQSWIDNIKGINLLNNDKIINRINESVILTTAVKANNLKSIAPIIKEGVIKRKNINKLLIISNENVLYATNVLKNKIKSLCSEDEWKIILRKAQFLNSAIDRQSNTQIVDNKIIPVVEPYYEWVIEDDNEINKLSGVTYVDDLEYFIEKKLYIVNATHVAYAYLGDLLDAKTIQEAMNYQIINELVEKFIKENIEYFVFHYGDNRETLSNYFKKIVKRFSNPKLNDPVKRVGRNPISKLGYNERILGPVLELFNLNLPYENGLKIIVAALLFYSENDDESMKIQETFDIHGIEKGIPRIVEAPKKVNEQIVDYYNLATKNPKNIFEDVV